MVERALILLVLAAAVMAIWWLVQRRGYPSAVLT